MSSNILRVLAVALVFFAVVLALAGWRAARIASAPPTATETAMPLRFQDPSEPEEQGYAAVVTTRALSYGEVLTEDDLAVAHYPQPLENTWEDVSAVAGSRVMRPVPAGQPLRAAELEPLNPLAEILQPGQRGLALSIDDVIGVGGHLRPGDRVDVLYQAQATQGQGAQIARRILGNVAVLGYGEEIDGVPLPSPEEEASGNNQRIARTAVLAIESNMAPLLLLAESTGSLRLSLVGNKESHAAVKTAEPANALFAVREELESLLGPAFLQQDVTRDEQNIPVSESPPPRRVEQYVGPDNTVRELPQ